MFGINEAVVLGNLGADPEIKTFADGGKIVTISVATAENWKDKDGNPQTSTEWHRVVLRGGNANTAEKFLKKGSKVHITGPMKTRKYTDSNDVTRYTTEIVGLKLIMLDSAPSQDNQAPQQQGYNNQMTNQAPQQQQQQGYNNQMDDNIPPFGQDPR